jgi:uncharacterized integral membrane protein
VSTSSSTQSSSGGIGFSGLLTVAFIVLKLTHVIDWSWWWVLSPLWIGLVLAVLIGACVLIVVGIADIRDSRRRQKRWNARKSVR